MQKLGSSNHTSCHPETEVHREKLSSPACPLSNAPSRTVPSAISLLSVSTTVQLPRGTELLWPRSHQSQRTSCHGPVGSRRLLSCCSWKLWSGRGGLPVTERAPRFSFMGENPQASPERCSTRHQGPHTILWAQCFCPGRNAVAWSGKRPPSALSRWGLGWA